jgi:hypothetical protein
MPVTRTPLLQVEDFQRGEMVEGILGYSQPLFAFPGSVFRGFQVFVSHDGWR